MPKLHVTKLLNYCSWAVMNTYAIGCKEINQGVNITKLQNGQ